jgi:eight-cysteine-cluster-containing protein
MIKTNKNYLFYGIIITLIVIIAGIFLWFQFGGFCGSSTYGSCSSDADCETGGCSGQVCQSALEENALTTCEWRDCYSAEKYNVKCNCVNNKCQWSK